MAQVEEIKHEIEKLTDDEFSSLRRWFIQKEWRLWDDRIEKDSREGKLNFLIDEAMKEKERGNLRPL
jgi:hypothetical protein